MRDRPQGPDPGPEHLLPLIVEVLPVEELVMVVPTAAISVWFVLEAKNK